MQVQCSDGQCMMSQEVSEDIPRLTSQTPTPHHQSHKEGPGGRTLQDSGGWGKASQLTYPHLTLERSPKEPDDKLIWNFITDP